jgi:hypothetical protein
VCVQPLSVLEEAAQGQGDLPLLIAFRPGQKGPGMKEGVAPDRFEIVHPVKRFRPWNAIGGWHVVSPRAGGGVTELSVADRYQWPTAIRSIMPHRTPDCPVNIAQSREFQEITSAGLLINHARGRLLLRANTIVDNARTFPPPSGCRCSPGASSRKCAAVGGPILSIVSPCFGQT